MTGTARRVAALAVTAVVALSLTACGGSAAGNQGGDPVATTQVDLPRSYRFQPASIVVAVGSTVTWTNSDNFTHSVQFDGDASPGTVISPGASTTRVFDKPGTYAYICNFHPQDMRGTVEVTAAPGTETP